MYISSTMCGIVAYLGKCNDQKCNDQKCNDQKCNDQKCNDQKCNDQKCNDQKCNDPKCNDQKCNDPKCNDPKCNDQKCNDQKCNDPKSNQCIEFILDGLTLLQNRGYDSAGISYIIDNIIKTQKFASTNTNNSLDKLANKLADTINQTQNICINLGIGHTRWATHGAKTDLNAHPHQDNKSRISLVHNGIIENYSELKTELKNLGYSFYSQTDSEIIAVLIGKFLDECYSIEDAIKNTILQLKGTWALVIISAANPNKMWITRNGSPLLLGLEDEYIMVASEQLAFGNNITKYIVLENHDIIEIYQDGNKIEYNSKNIPLYTIKQKSDIVIELLNQEYAHWMIKEIVEQPQSILRSINMGGRIKSNISVILGGLDTNKEQLMELNHILLLGCGTSYHAGLWALDIFKSLDIFDTVNIFDGADFQMKDIPKKGNTGIILLSQSGETKDLHRCIQIAKDYDLATIGVVNVPDSLIARETMCGVYLNAGREVAVASSKSFTNQCIVLSMIAVWFSQNRGTCMEKRKKIITDLRNLSVQMETTIQECSRQIQDYIPKFQEIFSQTQKTMFILGKGQGHAIALEGALKIKEVAYIHAEGYSTSALKHGPFALIEEKTPIILLDLDENNRDKTQNAYQEILARNAYILTITDNPILVNGLNTIKIEYNYTYGKLLANSVIQLLSYYLSISFGINPDFPRNLAKVVSVE
jgi:glucosamine--fructose-6-phosphate aminotransferase (isomerizing)